MPAQPTKTSPKVVIIKLATTKVATKRPIILAAIQTKIMPKLITKLRHKRVKMQDLAITHL